MKHKSEGEGTQVEVVNAHCQSTTNNLGYISCSGRARHERKGIWKGSRRMRCTGNNQYHFLTNQNHFLQLLFFPHKHFPHTSWALKIKSDRKGEPPQIHNESLSKLSLGSVFLLNWLVLSSGKAKDDSNRILLAQIMAEEIALSQQWMTLYKICKFFTS